MFDIVANKRNGVDVDKFDYLSRDCYNVGIKSSYDSSRLIMLSKVIDNQICYSHKEVFNLYNMFYTRYALFKQVYTHKIGKSVELMLVDALLEADKVMKISDGVVNGDMEMYSNLTDCIVREIEFSKSPVLLFMFHCALSNIIRN